LTGEENSERHSRSESRDISKERGATTIPLPFPAGSYFSLPQIWRISALKCRRIAHARDCTVQRDLHEKFRNSVLVFPLKVIAKIDEWQKLVYDPGGESWEL
jgi:hypothetical protein